MDPLKKKSNDLSQIRKAMGNVFASRKFSQKLKSGIVSSNKTTATAANDDEDEGDDDDDDDDFNEST